MASDRYLLHLWKRVDSLYIHLLWRNGVEYEFVYNTKLHTLSETRLICYRHVRFLLHLPIGNRKLNGRESFVFFIQFVKRWAYRTNDSNRNYVENCIGFIELLNYRRWRLSRYELWLMNFSSYDMNAQLLFSRVWRSRQTVQRGKTIKNVIVMVHL